MMSIRRTEEPAPKKRTQPHQTKKKLSLISLLYNSPTNKQQINKINNNSPKKERNAEWLNQQSFKPETPEQSDIFGFSNLSFLANTVLQIEKTSILDW